jgi:hypothetical protein
MAFLKDKKLAIAFVITLAIWMYCKVAHVELLGPEVLVVAAIVIAAVYFAAWAFGKITKTRKAKTT